jgi:hypothetical protein
MLLLSFAAGLAFERYVWEGRYEVVSRNGFTLRVDHDGGETFALDADSGWVRIPGPPPPHKAPADAFADLHDIPSTSGPQAGASQRP